MEKKTAQPHSSDQASDHAQDNSALTDAKAGVKPVDPDIEVGGPKGPEPTRFGDWEKGGRCTDF